MYMNEKANIIPLGISLSAVILLGQLRGENSIRKKTARFSTLAFYEIKKR